MDASVLVAGFSFAGLVFAAVFSFVREHRKDKATGDVAVRTVGLQVDAVAISNEAAAYQNLSARINLIDAAHAAERQSWLNALDNVRQETASLRDELTAARLRITQLERDREQDHDRMTTVNRQYRIAIAYIKVLRDHSYAGRPAYPPPPLPAELELDFNS